MTLLQLQFEFAKRVPRLINFCFENDFGVTVGEFYRPPELVKIYAAKGIGSLTSVHPDRLACDLNLFINGNLLTKTESYRSPGEYWESLSAPEVHCVWGGRFITRPDGNHFSIEWQGRR